jgi:hypothetical protein
MPSGNTTANVGVNHASAPPMYSAISKHKMPVAIENTADSSGVSPRSLSTRTISSCPKHVHARLSRSTQPQSIASFQNNQRSIA